MGQIVLSAQPNHIRSRRTKPIVWNHVHVHTSSKTLSKGYALHSAYVKFGAINYLGFTPSRRAEIYFNG